MALTHPLTKETIPGLNAITLNRDYTITNVPDGTYLARATYANDGKVIDPDWIIKNGEPLVTVSGGSITGISGQVPWSCSVPRILPQAPSR